MIFIQENESQNDVCRMAAMLCSGLTLLNAPVSFMKQPMFSSGEVVALP